MQILVAEDDPDIASLIVHYVQKAGWTPQVAATGDDALARARKAVPDLLILDVMLPGMSGFEVIRALRADARTADLPVIMVTARVDEGDRVVGLDLGADDYLAKPFSPNELMARIRALLRRVRRQDTDAEGRLKFGGIVMDVSRHTVTEHGRAVSLTAKEYRLLQYLLERPGRVVSRDRLLTDVWGYSYTGGTRTVDVHVRRLREKVPSLAGTLVTVKQFGYKLAETAETA
jgi:DNA-binding response OmpR family regulator